MTYLFPHSLLSPLARSRHVCICLSHLQHRPTTLFLQVDRATPRPLLPPDRATGAIRYSVFLMIIAQDWL